ncbi:hypothetical protein CR513_17330, partial [Mucuna pruriens]
MFPFGTFAKDGESQPEQLEPTPRGRSMHSQDSVPDSVGNELEELCLKVYKNSQIYQKKVKQFHDNRILRKEFRVGQKVLLFNSQLKLIVGKLRSKWDGPFVITNVFSYGVVEVRDEANNKNFKVNGHQIKSYHKGLTPMVDEVESISLMELALSKDTP